MHHTMKLNRHRHSSQPFPIKSVNPPLVSLFTFQQTRPPLSRLPWPFPRLLPLYNATLSHLPIYPQTNLFVSTRSWVVVKQCPSSNSQAWYLPCFSSWLLVRHLLRAMAMEGFVHQIVGGDVLTAVRRRRTGSHACSFAKSAVPSACVCRRGPMGTSRSVLATTVGRQKKEDPSAHRLLRSFSSARHNHI